MEQHEDEINISDIFYKLKKSISFIIVFTLVFTTSGFFLISQKKPNYESKALIKIGYNSNQLIESSKDLINTWPITIKNLRFVPLNNSVIQISTSSSSIEKNKNYLDTGINYISNRHENLLKKYIEPKKIH